MTRRLTKAQLEVEIDRLRRNGLLAKKKMNHDDRALSEASQQDTATGKCANPMRSGDVEAAENGCAEKDTND